jgi:hypothetical protein
MTTFNVKKFNISLKAFKFINICEEDLIDDEAVSGNFVFLSGKETRKTIQGFNLKDTLNSCSNGFEED